MISNQITSNLLSKLKIIPITIDWSLYQDNNFLSSTEHPRKSSFLCLNGFVMVGCHILTWIHSNQTCQTIDSNQEIDLLQEERTSVIS